SISVVSALALGLGFASLTWLCHRGPCDRYSISDCICIVSPPRLSLPMTIAVAANGQPSKTGIRQLGLVRRSGLPATVIQHRACRCCSYRTGTKIVASERGGSAATRGYRLRGSANCVRLLESQVSAA